MKKFTVPMTPDNDLGNEAIDLETVTFLQKKKRACGDGWLFCIDFGNRHLLEFLFR